MKKRILYLSQLYPVPPDSGGKIKTLATLMALSKIYQIFAIFISEEKPQPEDIRVLAKLGIKVKLFYSSQILASVKDDLRGLFWHIIRGIPHYVFQYTHPPAFPYIQKIIIEYKPDIIHVDHLNMAQYLPKVKNQVWILEHHNVESYLYWTRFLHSAKLTRKAYILIEMILTYIFEWRTLRWFNHIFAISEVETERIKRLFGVHNVSTQPLVYPILRIKKKLSEKPYILFIGTLRWPPNEDAVEWFIKEILPRIKLVFPAVEFHVVGRRFAELEKRLPKLAYIYLHGHQVSLTSFLSRAWVFVLPFRMGGGLRLKGLTALAAGLPIVASPLGVEGLHVTDNTHYLVASTPTEFADAVIRVVNSRTLQASLSKYAREYIQIHHDALLNEAFLDTYNKTTQKFS